MKTEELALEANSKIEVWANNKNKLVIAIDGYTGVGKTTLSDNLVKLNPEIVAVHFDDFLLPHKEVKNEDFELGYNDYPVIEKLINTFRISSQPHNTRIFNPISGAVDTPITYDFSKQILIIDGVRMFHPKLLDHLWDRRVYLEGDTNAIDKRRIERETAVGQQVLPRNSP